MGKTKDECREKVVRKTTRKSTNPINNLCKKCVKKCKQFAFCHIIKCPNFQSKGEKK